MIFGGRNLEKYAKNVNIYFLPPEKGQQGVACNVADTEVCDVACRELLHRTWRTSSAPVCAAIVSNRPAFRRPSSFEPSFEHLDCRNHCVCVFALCFCSFDVVFTLLFTSVLCVFARDTGVGLRPHACSRRKHRKTPVNTV